MKPTILLPASLLALLATLSAQDPQPSSWPKLDEAESARARALVNILIGADETDAEVGSRFPFDCCDFSLAGAKASTHAATIGAVLDRVVAEQHASLVVPLAKQTSELVRAWSVGWLAKRADEAHRDTLEKAAKAKRKRKLQIRCLAGLATDTPRR